MAFSNEAKLLITMTLKDNASKGLAKMRGETDKLEGSTGKAGQAFGKMGNVLKGVGIGVAVAGIAALTAALVDGVKSAIDEEKSLAKLDTALKATVPGWDGNRQAIDKLIDSRMDLGFSDDDLRASFSTLVVRSGNVEQAMKDQGLAMDYARFKGIDLASASGVMAKALMGNQKALKELGITLRKGATEGEIFAAVQKKVAGQAEAFAQTTEGAMVAASIAIQEVFEGIAKDLLPTIRDLAIFIRKDLLPAVNDLTKGWQTFIGVFTDSGERMNSFMPGKSKILKAINETQETAREGGRGLALSVSDGIEEGWAKGYALQAFHGMDRSIATATAGSHSNAVWADTYGRMAGARTVKGFADGIVDTSRGDLINTSMDALKQALDDSQSGMRARAFILGGDWIKTFNRGVKSKNADVRQATFETGTSALAGLWQGTISKEEAKRIAQVAQGLYRDGWTQGQVETELVTQGVGQGALKKLREVPGFKQAGTTHGTAVATGITASMPHVVASTAGIVSAGQQYLNDHTLQIPRPNPPPTPSLTTLWNNLQNWLNAHPVSIRTTAPVTTNTRYGGQSPRAMGGPVSAGGAYLVGEKGPELFTPNQSGRIIPNGNGGGGIVTIRNVVQVTARDVGSAMGRQKRYGPQPV